jgi:hypothetical protein
MKITVCGASLDKLAGQDLSNKFYEAVRHKFHAMFKEYHVVNCIVPIKPGIELLFGLAALEYKKNNPRKNIRIECVVGKGSGEDNWISELMDIRNRLVNEADDVCIVWNNKNEEFPEDIMKFAINRCSLLINVCGKSDADMQKYISYALDKGKAVCMMSTDKIKELKEI